MGRVFLAVAIIVLGSLLVAFGAMAIAAGSALRGAPHPPATQTRLTPHGFQ